MQGYTVEDLERWDDKIREKVAEFGLDPYPQTFEICDYNQMLGYMAYSGMPARYPHWSFGKQFERQKTLYDLGVTGLPYEMVINSDPSIAYLMADNSLLLQVLTMAHVYAHNDFFKNNATFRHTRANYTLEKFKAHADRVRKYRDDPSISSREVEDFLDAAHAISMNATRTPSVRKSSREEQERRAREAVIKKFREGKSAVEEVDEAALRRELDELRTKVPIEPDPDLLLFIRDNNPDLSEWERDLLTIVHEETLYFLPQIETKIMNEGWASYWHKTIMDSLELPGDMRMEFMVRHNQVLRPIPRSLNPYYVGFKIWEDIEKRWDNPSPEEREEYKRAGGEGRRKIFQVRESDRDESFLRQYLTRELMREMDLYQHEARGKERVVTKVASDEDWREVKDTIIKGVGMGGIPVIRVVDANWGGRGRLLLQHEFDGRELLSEYAGRTLKHIFRLWGGPVILNTVINGSHVRLTCDDEEEGIKTEIVSDEQLSLA